VQIPVEVTDLNVAWFAAVLDAPVSGMEVVDAHSGTTGRARVRLTYRGGRTGPEFVFVKLAPFDPRQRRFLEYTGIGVTETRVYDGLVRTGRVPVRAPSVWHAETDRARFVMVLEDLLSSGCRFPTRDEEDFPALVTSTVVELAALHAKFWESPEFASDLAWVPERAGFGPGGGKDPATAAAAGTFIAKALDRFGAEMPPVFTQVGRLYVERAAEILDLWDQGERTLIHGDAHLGNLFAEGRRTGFYDWAMVSRSPGVRDVAYFCCNSVPTPLRREMENELLDRYCAELAKEGVQLDRREAGEQYRLFSVFSWVSATSTAAMGSRWQPEAVGRGGMLRATAALEDLDAAGLLEARLS
jgi:hypothetical protein